VSTETLRTKFERDGLPTAVLDAVEASAYLAVRKETLYRMVRGGEIPHTRVGKSLRFQVEDLDAYLQERTSRAWERVDGRGRPRHE
jgi:excisionase family DNA binding protein